jgi:hypothetical protein
MLEWTVRWGVPLALITAYLVLGEPHSRNPSMMAHEALDAIGDALKGLMPRLF